jgi:hypothetical protein
MKQILKYTLGLAAVLSLGSCLKDKGFENGQYGINGADQGKIITLSAAQNVVTNHAVDFVNTPQVLTLSGIIFDADQPTTKDIVVTIDTLSARPSGLLTAYNTANPGSALTPLPAAWYQLLTGLQVTIPAGSKTGLLQIRIPNATLFDVNLTYGLAVTLVSNDAGVTTSTNLKNAIFAISAKNKYDGAYDIRLKALDWNNPSDPASNFGIWNQPASWPSWASGWGIEMITAGATAVKMFSPAHGAFIHVIFGATPTTYSGFGSTAPKFTFDAATDAMVDVFNDTSPSPPANGRVFLMNPAVTTSRYDANSKTIYAAIILRQPARTDLQIFDTLTYVGPR